MKRIGLLILILWASAAGAVEVHFDKTSGKVTGYSLSAVPPTNDTQKVILPGDSPPWPAPPGCPAGREQWTVVDTTTDPPQLRVNPALIFFLCEPVTSAADVQRVLSAHLTTLARGRDAIDLLTEGTTVLAILAVECPQPGISHECDGKRNWAQDTMAELKAIDAQRQALQAQAAQLIQAQGWE